MTATGFGCLCGGHGLPRVEPLLLLAYHLTKLSTCISKLSMIYNWLVTLPALCKDPINSPTKLSATVAQLVEHRFSKCGVGGSKPSHGKVFRVGYLMIHRST